MSAAQLSRPLSPDEERRLVEQYRHNPNAAIEARLVRSQLGLVHQLARRHAARGVDLDELVQEGSLGLLHAIRRFDPARGARLSTYAAWWIRAFQWRYVLQNRRLVRVGTTQAQRRVFFKLGRVRARLEALGLAATPERIGAQLAVAPKVVSEVMARLEGGDASLDARRDGKAPLAAALRADEPAADEQLADHELGLIVRHEREALRDELVGRRRALFDARWSDEPAPSLVEMGRRLGISRERARQLDDDVGRRLRARVEKRVVAGARG